MAQIIAFVSPKGGCGSTFLCAGLYKAFKENNHKVLALDFCFEKGTLDFVLGFQNDYIYTLEDVLNGNCSFSEILCRDGESHACFARAGYEYASFDFKKTASFFGDFDYVLIDMPDRDEIVKEIVYEADKLVCVTDLMQTSVKICDDFLSKYDCGKSLVAINKIIPSYCSTGIHLTVDEALDLLGIPLLGLMGWTPDAYVVSAKSVGCGFSKPLTDKAFGNMMQRLDGKSVRACEFKNIYDCFKIGRGICFNNIGEGKEK